MKIVKYKCDACNKEVDKVYEIEKIMLRDEFDNDGYETGKKVDTIKKDLCEECVKKLEKFEDELFGLRFNR